MSKIKVIFSMIIIVVVMAVFGWLYFFYFNVERSNQIRRSIDKYTGQNLTISVFSLNGQLIKQWKNVSKVTSGSAGGADQRNYTYFYTKEGKYVQLPNSVYYIAEEE